MDLLSYFLFGLLPPIVPGLIGLFEGYFVYTNSGEGGINCIARMIQMIEGGLHVTVIGGIVSLFLLYPIGLLLQLLGMLGVL